MIVCLFFSLLSAETEVLMQTFSCPSEVMNGIFENTCVDFKYLQMFMQPQMGDEMMNAEQTGWEHTEPAMRSGQVDADGFPENYPESQDGFPENYPESQDGFPENYVESQDGVGESGAGENHPHAMADSLAATLTMTTGE